MSINPELDDEIQDIRDLFVTTLSGLWAIRASEFEQFLIDYSHMEPKDDVLAKYGQMVGRPYNLILSTPAEILSKHKCDVCAEVKYTGASMYGNHTCGDIWD